MTDRPDPADWIAAARSLTQSSSSIPLGVPVSTHVDMLLRDTRRDLRTACNALEAVLEPHQLHEVPGGQRWCLHCGGDWPCLTVDAAAGALS